MSWTDERIESLKTMWEQGQTASQIAEALGGVSRNAVIGKAHRLGLQARPSPVRAEERGDTPAPIATPEAASASPPPRAAPIRKPVRAVAAKPAKTTLLDLSEKVCKWPIGHPGEPDFHFCGKPSATGFPYCGEHCLIAYQAQQPRRDRSRPPPPMMPGMRR